MGIPKPLASLSSGLLARKGQARPAMRPQGFASLAGLAQAGDQLGWNDMGEAPDTAAPMPEELPPVLVEREVLADRFVAPAPILADSGTVAATPIARTGKAAFTLRLDAERHLRLRLASAAQGQSSQQLVTAALDQFLANLPEVEKLARQLGRAKR